MTTTVRALGFVSAALLITALALALIASTGASADESSDPPDERGPGWMMTGDLDRPMMDHGQLMGRHGAMDAEQLREHHATMMGDEQLRERHRERHDEGDHHGPMHGDAVREQMREDCDHRDGPQRSRDRTFAPGISRS